ncbi:Diguanylate phosphodiesterase, EAL domain [Syntrophomonas zehnderi OL-4]|uniref:Diguanylate phosphodiesterase, EAL domain n=1 Tax=Syntrophomonas zehnderi OL-4 TaxID=690567 RepID=A0A0E4C9L1_9FIRM|nr:EAL domain-containing protein [Syntrophomonas zehnderi]CFY04416.1 Diguanylate phosphodiesterase, EAL domain [Syntrophomonas zehnderi OL-4]
MHRINEISVVPFFQPIVCIDTANIYGYEVLGRYRQNNLFESLGHFFHNPDLSSQEKIRVDRMIRFKALDMMKMRNSKAKLFINIQPEWLLPYINQSMELPTIEQLTKYSIDGEQIIIEISEDKCGDVNVLMEIIKRYRAVGCKIAIDDIGEGFSNLERVALLNPDFIKVGAGFIHRSKSYSLLESMGGFCEKSGVNLVLEEVEDMKQFQMGLDAGVRYFQGYLYAIPQPDILDKASCAGILHQGLDEYLDRKSSLQQKLNKLADDMNKFIAAASADIAETDPMFSPREYINRLLPLAPNNCLKFYICSSRGEQLTPNYTRDHQKWLVEADYIGRNWCWRPYFFPKVAEANRMGRGVLSDPYQDLENRRQIYTFVFPINAAWFLFIDCQYD